MIKRLTATILLTLSISNPVLAEGKTYQELYRAIELGNATIDYVDLMQMRAMTLYRKGITSEETAMRVRELSRGVMMDINIICSSTEYSYINCVEFTQEAREATDGLHTHMDKLVEASKK